ncbi:MAG: hypothetical protein ACYCQI_04270 [Gammaproteobacteria bacterium]
MKHKISFALDVPSSAYSLAMEEVYVQKDQIIAISKLSAPEEAGTAAIGHLNAEIEVETSIEHAKLPVKHYVISEESGWWTQNDKFTHIKSREELSSLDLGNATCLYMAEHLISAAAKYSVAKEEKVATSESEKAKSKTPDTAAPQTVISAPKITEKPVTELLDKIHDTNELGYNWEALKSTKNVKIGATVIGLGIGLFAAAKLLKQPVSHALESLRKVKP